MYRRPKFLEVLHEIREEMSREAEYDIEVFAEMVRTGEKPQFKVSLESGVTFHSLTTLKELTATEAQFPKTQK